MSNSSNILRGLAIYGLCLPLAAFLGYLLATPLDPTTYIVVGIVMVLMLAPALLKWHHFWLIATWNMSLVVFVLPGRPAAWMVMAFASFLISVFQFALNRRKSFSTPSITRALLFLAVVVLITMKARGGMGLRSLGSAAQGGKNYFLIFAAILGYFAFKTRKIPPEHVKLYLGLFFLGSATEAIGNLASFVGPQFNFLFLFFPIESTASLDSPFIGTTSIIARSWGVSVLGLGLFCFMLVRYSIRGVMDIKHPLRMFVFFCSVGFGLIGGFRSILAIFLLTGAVLAYLEGVFRTRMLPVAMLVMVLVSALLIGFANRLPLGIQRSLSFLPIDIDPIARIDAQGSSEWRLRIWRDVIPEIPSYLLLGKGYLYSASDSNIIQASMQHNSEIAFEAVELVGNYHNGPLSLIIAMGLFGTVGFVWFIIAGLRALHHNYRYGDPAYETINRFLYAYFIARVIFFFAVFGGFHSDLALFTGLLGLSISLNGGIAKPAPALQPEFTPSRVRLFPAGMRRPVGV